MAAYDITDGALWYLISAKHGASGLWGMSYARWVHDAAPGERLDSFIRQLEHARAEVAKLAEIKAEYDVVPDAPPTPAHQALVKNAAALIQKLKSYAFQPDDMQPDVAESLEEWGARDIGQRMRPVMEALDACKSPPPAAGEIRLVEAADAVCNRIHFYIDDPIDGGHDDVTTTLADDQVRDILRRVAELEGALDACKSQPPTPADTEPCNVSWTGKGAREAVIRRSEIPTPVKLRKSQRACNVSGPPPPATAKQGDALADQKALIYAARQMLSLLTGGNTVRLQNAVDACAKSGPPLPPPAAGKQSDAMANHEKLMEAANHLREALVKHLPSLEGERGHIFDLLVILADALAACEKSGPPLPDAELREKARGMVDALTSMGFPFNDDTPLRSRDVYSLDVPVNRIQDAYVALRDALGEKT